MRRQGQTIDDIPADLLADCVQLVKANSIEGLLLSAQNDYACKYHRLLTGAPGNKKNNIHVVYTPWANLKKTGSMDVGQVSYHHPKQVKCMQIAITTALGQIDWSGCIPPPTRAGQTGAG